MFEDDDFEIRMKNEITPVISHHLGISLELLKSFPVEILNRILTSINIVPDDTLKRIVIINANHPEKIPDLIDEHLGIGTYNNVQNVPVYDESLDLKAGILAIVPEDVRDKVESKIDEITDKEKLIDLSQKPLNELLADLGIEEKVEVPEIEEYDEKRDVIAGILAMVPDENLKDEIEEKLNEVEDVNTLIKYATMEYNDFLRELGIENEQESIGMPFESEIPGTSVESMYSFQSPFTNRPTDINDDIKAGILARLPPSIRDFIQDKIMAINNTETLIKLSNMNYLQIQNELGLPVTAPALAPPSVINPIDTAARREQQIETSNASQSSQSQPDQHLDEQTQERLKQRNEEIEKYSEIIIKIVEKVCGKEPPKNFEEKKKILKRIYPSRLKRLVEIFKAQKNKKRILLMFDWFVISQRIEEIETYVEHWQGVSAGIGGYRAAINVSRYDTIIEHLKENELKQIINTSLKALNKIHDPNIQVRAVGVEEIKLVANILLHKVR
ncbi:MAG: hypothetical protein ACTSQO_14975 [Candidatus Helarchaeota archaeon]